MARRPFLPALVLALLAALVAAPAALADVVATTTLTVKPSVRVEALSHAVAPATSVLVPTGSTVTDSVGATASFTKPMAMVGLAKAADRHAFTFEGLAFINSIAGLGGAPDWNSWWLYQVNGWSPDIGAADLPVVTDDKVVFFEVSSAAPWLNKQLVVTASPAGVRPGEPVTLRVREDDLAKPNNLASAERWKLDPASVETLADSPLSAGAVLHVGSRVYTLGAPDHEDGLITLTDLPRGTYAVWAEKPYDASFNYVRSAPKLIDVNPGASLTKVVVTPNPYVAGRTMKVSFLLSKKATVGMKIYNARGVRVATVAAKTFSGGTRALYWNGKAAAPLTTRLTIKLRAVDTWGRVTTKTVSVAVAR
jgi:hypothetical protein